MAWLFHKVVRAIQEIFMSACFCWQKVFLLLPYLLILLVVVQAICLPQSSLCFKYWLGSTVVFVLYIYPWINLFYHVFNFLLWYILVIIDILWHIIFRAVWPRYDIWLLWLYHLLYLFPSGGDYISLKFYLSRRVLGRGLVGAMIYFNVFVLLDLLNGLLNEYLSSSNEIMRLIFSLIFFAQFEVVAMKKLVLNIFYQLLHVFFFLEASWFTIFLEVIVNHLVYLLICNLQLRCHFWYGVHWSALLVLFLNEVNGLLIID